MRRFVIGVLLLAFLLVGCSDSNDGEVERESATTSTSQALNQETAADRSRAEAANLKLSDMPTGWTSEPSDDSGTEESQRVMASCLGVTYEEFTKEGPANV